MALVKSRAVSLKSYRLGETSKVVVCYTRDYGKVRFVAKGARKGGGRLGAALEPMVVSGVVFYLKQGRDLSLVSQAEIERLWPEFRRDVVRMAYAGTALELTDAMVSEREPDPALFDLIESTLSKMASERESLLDVVLWNFELSLASALGYSPELSSCVVCGGSHEGDASFAARRGGTICRGCVGEEPGARPLSTAGASILARLPDTPDGDIPVAVRDEISDALMGFLEEHAGHELRLRSLEFLAQVRRTGHRPTESEQRHEG